MFSLVIVDCFAIVINIGAPYVNIYTLHPASASVTTVTKLCGMASTLNAFLSSSGRLPRSNFNMFVVNIDIYDGVFRLTLGSLTPVIVYAASFRNIKADAALSKSTIVFVGRVVLAQHSQ